MARISIVENAVVILAFVAIACWVSSFVITNPAAPSGHICDPTTSSGSRLKFHIVKTIVSELIAPRRFERRYIPPVYSDIIVMRERNLLTPSLFNSLASTGIDRFFDAILPYAPTYARKRIIIQPARTELLSIPAQYRRVEHLSFVPVETNVAASKIDEATLK